MAGKTWKPLFDALVIKAKADSSNSNSKCTVPNVSRLSDWDLS